MQQTRSFRDSIDPRPVVLISGATGFLGGELLLRLLDSEPHHHRLLCLVRADSHEAAEARGWQRLHDLLGRETTPAEQHRVSWIRSDLEEPRLGWNGATWTAVARNLVAVYHCAASVSFDLPLDAAQRINVDGTKHIFELAQLATRTHNNFRRFHHVSTAYVAGVTDAVVDANFLPDDRAANFRNTYERTKARAERFLRSQTDVPVSIYRPSIVGGHTRTGRTDNWNVLYVPMKMVARNQLPVFPIGGRALIDSVGVDFVVDAMVALGRAAESGVEAYHLTAGPTAFSLTDLMKRTAERADKVPGYRPSHTRLVSHAAWSALTGSMAAAARLPKRFTKTRRKGRVGQRALSGCAVYVSYTNVNTVFSTAREHRMLRGAGVVMPPGLDYLDTIVDYALTHNFGKIPDHSYYWKHRASLESTGAIPTACTLDARALLDLSTVGAA